MTIANDKETTSNSTKNLAGSNQATDSPYHEEELPSAALTSNDCLVDGIDASRTRDGNHEKPPDPDTLKAIASGTC